MGQWAITRRAEGLTRARARQPVALGIAARIRSLGITRIDVRPDATALKRITTITVV